MFGCRDASEILGHSPEEVSPEFQPDGVRSAEKVAANDRAVLEGTPLAFEWVHTRRDGTPFYTEVSLNAMEIRGKTYVQSIVRDISDRKRAEQAAALAGRKLHMMNSNTMNEADGNKHGASRLAEPSARKQPGVPSIHIPPRHLIGILREPASDRGHQRHFAGFEIS